MKKISYTLFPVLFAVIICNVQTMTGATHVTHPVEGVAVDPAALCPKPQLPSSFLFDVMPLKHGNSTAYSPLPDHILLAAKASKVASETVGAYSYVVFYKKDDVLEKDIFEVSEAFTQGKFDKDSLPEDIYNTYLRLLSEHSPEGSTDLCNIFTTMLSTDSSTKRSSCQGLYHAEQRMLIDMRHSILKMMAKFMGDKEPNELMGIGINMHSTQDVCSTCGPTIENVLCILKNDVLDTFKKAKMAYEAGEKKKSNPTNINIVKPFATCAVAADTFSLFAVVSSSCQYRTRYLERPNLRSENAADYFRKYVASGDVRKDAFDISSLNSKALYFWIPNLKGIDVQKSETGFSAELLIGDSSITRLQQLLEVTLDERCLSKITELRLPKDVEISASPNNPGVVIHPELIGDLVQLSVLNLAETNARSSILINMLTPLTLLRYLNLNGALVHYQENGSPTRTALFQSIEALPVLEELHVERNKLHAQDLLILFKSESKLIILNGARNLFFQSPLDTPTLNIVREFRKIRTVDLSHNGDSDDEWQTLSNLTLDNTNAQNLQQAVQQPKTPLVGLSEEDWKKIIEQNNAPGKNDHIHQSTLKKVRNGNFPSNSPSYIRVEAIAKKLKLL